MTKEEIKALVAGKIAGQGTMVDAGGALPTILNEIIDLIPEGGGGGVEPLIVEGTIDSESFEFFPDAGQPTFDEAQAAFLAGTPVILKSEFDSVQVIADEGTFIHGLFNDGGEATSSLISVIWKPE